MFGVIVLMSSNGQWGFSEGAYCALPERPQAATSA